MPMPHTLHSSSTTGAGFFFAATTAGEETAAAVVGFGEKEAEKPVVEPNEIAAGALSFLPAATGSVSVAALPPKLNPATLMPLSLLSAAVLVAVFASDSLTAGVGVGAAAASPPKPAKPPKEGGDAFAEEEEELTSSDLVTTGAGETAVVEEDGTPPAKPLSVLKPAEPKPNALLLVDAAAAAVLVLVAVLVSNADPVLAAAPNAEAKSVLPNPTVATPLTGAAAVAAAAAAVVAGLSVGDLVAVSVMVFLESYGFENAAEDAGGAAGRMMGETEPDEDASAEPK